MQERREWHAANAYSYNQSSPLRWILSHIMRYRWFALATLVSYILAWLAYSQARVVIGTAADRLFSGQGGVGWLAVMVLLLLCSDAVTMLVGSVSAENIAARFEADARDELYASLLGKSQAFHDRQRVGDVMARATDDTSQLAGMIAPGMTLIYEAILGTIVPFAFIAVIDWRLLLVPALFFVAYYFALRRYMANLNPVIGSQREQFGSLNATLEETLSGIEVVKASATEPFERGKYWKKAHLFRELFVKQGQIEARYLPMLLFGIAYGAFLGHALWMFSTKALSLADVVASVGLMNLLRFPTFISIFAFSVLQSGYAGSQRILSIIAAETDLDQNVEGYSEPMNGAIQLRNVRFGYQDTSVLEGISLDIKPGQTVAIVGQTGSGKSALTEIINRTYDVWDGSVLVDGVDVRDWNLDTLRAQIAKIEQDVFLFSRSVAENIAFGAPNASRDQIEAAAKAAQAHEFIIELPDGYDTVIGERGATLSGGQRQRVALARAFLRDPRILILDDSTSAVDSATEDQIQRALRQAQEGRTTLLITHRMSQIRWADVIVVLDQGVAVAVGTHDELLRRSPHYRRMFARYETALPPLEEIVEA